MSAHLFYNLVSKPTYLHQFRALPHKAMQQVIDKVESLQYDPAPDAKNKKRLTEYKGAVYRIRAGNYRIAYTFDVNEGWVALLGVGHRKDFYRKGQFDADDLDISLDGVPDENDILRIESEEPADGRSWDRVFVEREEPPETPIDDLEPVAPPEITLPKQPSEALLRQAGVPAEHYAALLSCRTLDDLIEAPVPKSVTDLVFDLLSTPDYDRVLEQPNFIIASVDDLRRYHDGSLVSFLLQLDPEQQRFVEWAVNSSGPALVKGGPGTGKTIIALYRIRSLIAALRRAGVEQPRILFTAYTNTLVQVSQQLLRELLGPDAGLVTVRTADKLSREIADEAGRLPGKILDDGQARAVIWRAKDRLLRGSPEDRQLAKSIANLNLDYLLEEVDKVIVAREHLDLDAYLAEDRTGRGVGLTANRRSAIWRLHEEREALTAQTGELTWSQFRCRVAELVRAGHGPAPFDGIMIDEAQDLEPTVLRLLIALCKSKDRLFLTADPNQSIYGSGFRWADIHEDLKFRGRTGVLRKNYRSTIQIMRAAESFLAGAELESAEEPIECARNGRLPAVDRAVSRSEETILLTQFLGEATRELRVGLGGCAVLVPTEPEGREIARNLTGNGLAARFMKRRDIELDSPAIKVVTMHSAKGLEFPIVAVAGNFAGLPKLIPAGSTDDQVEETLRIGRRILYVAMSRAMDRLLIIAPENHPLLSPAGFNPAWWDVGATNSEASQRAAQGK